MPDPDDGDKLRRRDELRRMAGLDPAGTPLVWDDDESIESIQYQEWVEILAGVARQDETLTDVLVRLVDLCELQPPDSEDQPHPRRAATVEVERYDGEDVDLDDLREALETEGYRLSTSCHGRQLLSRVAASQAREQLERALTLLDDGELLRPDDG